MIGQSLESDQKLRGRNEWMIDLMPLGERKTVDEDQDRRRIEDDTSIEVIV